MFTVVSWPRMWWLGGCSWSCCGGSVCWHSVCIGVGGVYVGGVAGELEIGWIAGEVGDQLSEGNLGGSLGGEIGPSCMPTCYFGRYCQTHMTCRPQLLHFQPYTKDQIVIILRERLGSNSELVDDPTAAQFCARKVAAVHGDLRKALDVCRRAVELASQECSKAVHVSHTASVYVWLHYQLYCTKYHSRINLHRGGRVVVFLSGASVIEMWFTQGTFKFARC